MTTDRDASAPLAAPPAPAPAREDDAVALLRRCLPILKEVFPCGSDELCDDDREKWRRDNERLVFAPARALLPEIEALLSRPGKVAPTVASTEALREAAEAILKQLGPMDQPEHSDRSGIIVNVGKLKVLQAALASARQPEVAGELRRLRRFIEFVRMWCERGPPHGGPGKEATALDAIRNHPVLQALRDPAPGSEGGSPVVSLVTEIRGRPIFWNGHLCEGDYLVLFDRGTFCLWTRCGRHDVPAGAAWSQRPEDKVVCEGCLAALSAPAAAPEGGDRG